MTTDGGHDQRGAMTIADALETAARGLDAVIAEELRELAARGTADDVLIQERARLEARRTAILADLWTKLEGDWHQD